VKWSTYTDLLDEQVDRPKPILSQPRDERSGLDSSPLMTRPVIMSYGGRQSAGSVGRDMYASEPISTSSRPSCP
jgi:hypothetical protein